MTALTLIAAFVQIVPLDKGLETGAKENKPIVVLAHRKDWQGEEKTAKALKEALGDVAAKVVLAHVLVAEGDEMVKRYELTKLDGTLLVLDPKLAPAVTQILGRADKPDAETTAEAIKATVVEALKKYADHEGCRAAFDKVWAAIKKKDAEAFRGSIWPKQVETLGGPAVDKIFEQASQHLAAVDATEFDKIDVREAEGHKKKDETIEAVYRMRLLFVTKGKKDGTNFWVVKTSKGFFVDIEK